MRSTGSLMTWALVVVLALGAVVLAARGDEPSADR